MRALREAMADHSGPASDRRRSVFRTNRCCSLWRGPRPVTKPGAGVWTTSVLRPSDGKVGCCWRRRRLTNETHRQTSPAENSGTVREQQWNRELSNQIRLGGPNVEPSGRATHGRRDKNFWIGLPLVTWQLPRPAPFSQPRRLLHRFARRTNDGVSQHRRRAGHSRAVSIGPAIVHSAWEAMAPLATG
jgi:hypothetical protein